MTTPIDALAGVPNAQQVLPHLVTGGQPGPDHFKALRAAGVEVVLDIRDPMEPRPFDQAALLRDLGFEYVNIPVVAGNLSDELLERLLGVLRGAEGRSTLVHCASGNRVGGALIPYLMLDHGFSEEDATMAAMRMGMRSAELMEWGQAYARSHAKE